MSARVGGLITLHLIKPSTSRSIWSAVTSVGLDVREWTRRQTNTHTESPFPPVKGDGNDTAAGYPYSLSIPVEHFSTSSLSVNWSGWVPAHCAAVLSGQWKCKHQLNSYFIFFPSGWWRKPWRKYQNQNFV